ncbi:MAG: 6-hydroxymethylpterin diphosphokinase MptE-like protein [Bacteroidota bacterium]
MKFKRFKLSEITLNRILKGIYRRITKIPHRISWNITVEGKKNSSRIEKFNNIHKGETCILLCNGPSLKDTDFSFIEHEVTFGLNRIYLLFDKMGFQADYHVCVNNLVLEQFSDEIESLEMPKFLNWEMRESFNSETVYYIYDNFLGPSFSKDISKSLKPSATVTYAALQIIYYMGFSKVLIIGMDHSFDYRGNVNETQKVKTKDVNHFVENYFPKGSKWETPDLESSEYYYKIAKKVYENDNREIIDCTPGGNCDVFKKGNLEKELDKVAKI